MIIRLRLQIHFGNWFLVPVIRLPPAWSRCCCIRVLYTYLNKSHTQTNYWKNAVWNERLTVRINANTPQKKSPTFKRGVGLTYKVIHLLNFPYLRECVCMLTTGLYWNISEPGRVRLLFGAASSMCRPHSVAAFGCRLFPFGFWSAAHVYMYASQSMIPARAFQCSSPDLNQSMWFRCALQSVVC